MRPIPRLLTLLLALCFVCVPLLAFAEDDGSEEPAHQGPDPDTLDKLVQEKTGKPAEAPKPADVKPAEAAAPAAPAEVAKPVEAPKPSFPVDSRRLRVTIKTKTGKVYAGVVKHFLASDNLIDHQAEPDFVLSAGPTVNFKTDEFALAWDNITKIDFNTKNKENGEISCVEATDSSPDRRECMMINEFLAYAKDNKTPGGAIVQDKNLFRFVIDTGKGEVRVDSHLGKVRITNARDETRVAQDLAKELRKVFAEEILTMSFN